MVLVALEDSLLDQTFQELRQRYPSILFRKVVLPTYALSLCATAACSALCDTSVVLAYLLVGQALLIYLPNALVQI